MSTSLSRLSSRPTLILLFALCCGLLAACKEDPQKAKLKHVERGRQYLKEKKYAEARIEFRNALVIDKKMADAFYGLSEASLGMNNVQEAFDALRQVIELDQNNLDARVRLGNIYVQYVRDDNIREAERLAGEVLARDQNHVEGRILLASVRTAQGKWDEAKKELERAIAINPKRVESHLSLARFWEQRGKAQADKPERDRLMGEAERVFKEAVTIDPNSSVAHLAYGDFLYSSQRAGEAEAELKKATELDPQDRVALTAMARFYETQGRFDEAERYMKQLADLSNDRNAGRAQIIDLHARAGRLDQAVGEYQELVNTAPKYVHARVRLAELLLSKGDVKGAQQHVEEALKQSKQDTEALLVRGRIRTLAGNLRDAIADFEQVIKQEPALSSALYYMAEAQLQNSDAEQARRYVNDLLKFYPDNPAGLLMMVRIYLNQGQPNAAEAIKTADKIINGVAFLKGNAAALQASRLPAEVLPDLESKGHTARAVAKIQSKDLAGAQADLEKAIQADPRNAEARSNLAGLFLLKNDVANAQRVIEEALAVAPNNNNVVNMATTIYIQQGKFDEAHAKLDSLIAAQPNKSFLSDQKVRVYAAQKDGDKVFSTLMKMIEADPDNLNAYFQLSAYYHSQRKIDEAVAKLQEIIKRRPDNPRQMAQAHLISGMLEAERSRHDEAIKHYEKSLNFDSRSVASAIAMNNLAWTMAEHNKGNLDKAADLAQRAIELLPSASFYDTLGYVFHKRRLYGLAVDRYQKAIEKAPNEVNYHLHLAEALKENNEGAKARQIYERAQKMCGTCPKADQIKQGLAAL
jgi:tetratricopeptide (TPR) repeat protein